MSVRQDDQVAIVAGRYAGNDAIVDWTNGRTAECYIVTPGRDEFRTVTVRCTSLVAW